MLSLSNQILISELIPRVFSWCCVLRAESCLSQRDPGTSRLHLSSTCLAFGKYGSVDSVLSLLGRKGRSEREVDRQRARSLLASLVRIRHVWLAGHT